MSRVVNRRIRLLLFVLAAAFGALFLRAAWLQAIRAQSLSRLGETQHREEVTLPASRGTIFDRMGVQLALGEQATTVYADPLQIRNPRAVAGIVGRVLGTVPARLYPRLADRTHGFVYVERQADPARAAALARKHLAGVGFYPEERRGYPQAAVAAQLLGYVGVDDKGLAGMEFQLDRQLAGRPGHETVVKDATGRAVDVIVDRPELQGRDVTLTIDHTIQANAEEVLRATVRKWGAKDATAVVLDPRTGDVLAMAVEPGYDANRFPSVSPELQRNRAVTDTYEPGSTFKLVTVAAALSDRLVSPSTPFTPPYSIPVADRVIHDAEPRGTGRHTVEQILAHSSNVGAITLAEMLGRERLASWISRFGFGRTTGIEFPGESPGIVLAADKWSGSTIGNVPIGQGIAVTPVQMASMYAAIANHGVWVQPHLVARVGDRPTRQPARHRIVTRWLARELTLMLQNVVLDGTGTLAQIPGYHVAGKTGTAAKPDPQGGYSNSKYVASFVGFAPATRPRAVVLVAVDEPHGAIWGGVVAAPAFKAIMQQTLQYLSAPPDAPATASSSR